jgi:hypothetical protein
VKAPQNDMQILPLEQMKHNYQDFVNFSKEILKEKIDY